MSSETARAVVALVVGSIVFATAAGAQAGRRRPQPVVAVSAPDESAPEPEEAPTAHDPLLAPVARPPQVVGTFDEMVLAMKRQSADLRQAMADVRRAEGQWRIALSATLPTATAQGTGVHQLITSRFAAVSGVDGTVTRYDLPEPNVAIGTVVVTQPLVAVAAWQAIGSAAIDEEAANASLGDAKRRLTQGIVGAALAVATAERTAEAQRNGLRAALDREALTRRRYRLGAGTTLDVARAELDTDAARTTVITADEALRRAREALGIALGIAGPVGVEGNGAVERILDRLEQACTPLTAPGSRGDVVADRTRAEAAERRVTEVWLRQLPTLSARADATASTSAQTSLPPVVASVQGVLSVPIWDGGARYGAARVAEANLDAARVKAAATERQASIENDQATRAVRVAEAQLHVAQSARNHAAEADRLQRVAFSEGRGTSLELVTAGASLRSAEVTLLLQELATLQARLGARLALATCQW